MKKKLLVGILASTLILGNMTGTVLATQTTGEIQSQAQYASTFTPSPESEFSVENNYITSYKGPGGVVVIPPEVDGQAIMGIESEVLNNADITTLVLPNYIEFVGHWNLGGLNLTEVIIGNPEIRLGLSTFSGTPWKTSQEFLATETGKLLAYNGDDANVVVPDHITSIGEYSLEFNFNISSITLPSSVTTLHTGSIWCCESLETLYLPTSVTKIDNYALHTTELDQKLSIYYEGTEAQKEEIFIGTENDIFHNATWIYSSTMPEGNSTPEPTTPNYAAWAEPQVNFSQENGLTVDSLGLDYTKNITRLQIADLLVNMVEKTSGETLPTSDEVFTDTSSEAVSKASKAGIISGKDVGIFAPDATATRQEISIMIVRAIEKLEELSGESYIDHSLTSLEGFADFSDTADWAKSFVAILANNGIMSGSDGNLTPLSATSIQECLVLNNNLFQLGK